MSALRRARGPITVVHAVKTAFAAMMIGPLGIALARGADEGPVGVAVRAMQLGTEQRSLALWVVCGYALVAPLLVQWLLTSMLGEPRRLSTAVYLRALALSLGRYLVLGVAGMGAFWAASELTRITGSQLELFAATLPLCGGALACAWLATAHDLGQASLARGNHLWRAMHEGARKAGPRFMTLHAALASSGLALFALGEAVARTQASPASSLVATQALALATTLTKAAWLACACGSHRA